MPAGNRTVGIPKDLGIVVRVQIDITGRDDQAIGIDELRGIARIETTDLGDPPVLDANVGALAWHARAINNHARLN